MVECVSRGKGEESEISHTKKKKKKHATGMVLKYVNGIFKEGNKFFNSIGTGKNFKM